MPSRLVRVSVAVLSLIAVGVPAPARATTVSQITFFGELILNGPLGNAFNPTVAGLPFAPTVPPATHCNLPLPGLPNVPGPNCHLDWGGHHRTIVSLRPLAGFCINSVVNVAKPNKAPAHVGTCNFGLAAPAPGHANAIHGFCDLNGGQTRHLFTDALLQTYLVDLHFNSVQYKYVIEGHATKLTGSPQPRSLVVGEMFMVPLPEPFPPLIGNACMNSTADVFTLSGYLTIAAA